MINIFSFFLGFVIGFLVSIIAFYYWIRRKLFKILEGKNQILKDILKLLESKEK